MKESISVSLFFDRYNVRGCRVRINKRKINHKGQVFSIFTTLFIVLWLHSSGLSGSFISLAEQMIYLL